MRDGFYMYQIIFPGMQRMLDFAAYVMLLSTLF
jgi:hypothetical protein